MRGASNFSEVSHAFTVTNADLFTCHSLETRASDSPGSLKSLDTYSTGNTELSFSWVSDDVCTEKSKRESK